EANMHVGRNRKWTRKRAGKRTRKEGIKGAPRWSRVTLQSRMQSSRMTKIIQSSSEGPRCLRGTLDTITWNMEFQ
ncbi:hypothetical protein HAX54_014100, partial [Datura stramonium]|nr:hypothetical protein [Datura stramonium]